MGQKINPLGFRLGTNQDHYSIWFSKPKMYSESLQEDQKIRTFIKNYIRSTRISPYGVEGIASISIYKRIDLIEVIILLGFPKLLIENRPQGLVEELNCGNQKLNIVITKIKKPYGNPNILAEFIAGQLKNRVSVRQAMKKAIELAEEADIKGIQVQIAGRLNGQDIARVQWIREGRLPRQTLRATFDYCSYPVRTISGVMGIKIWIFVDETK
uniref:Small ribosomal subunit protein uS3c n=1 Tax=Cuscuta boldinghii TaxID=437623 RepID=A0A4Y5MXC8_9ASTE|nr:ribosomal protein S3 [Cuscuta boldinghii]QCW07719.1 ribosomal protein S3 [Cuscuta boldinghii]